AEQGNGNSYINLAHLYAGARGFTPDYSQAYFWSLVAQASPWPITKRPSQTFLQFLRGKLSPQQVAEAETQAESWKDKHTSNIGIGALGATWSLLLLPENAPGE